MGIRTSNRASSLARQTLDRARQMTAERVSNLRAKSGPDAESDTFQTAELPAGSAPRVQMVGNRTVVDLTAGDDRAKISQLEDGRLRVSTADGQRTLTRAQSQRPVHIQGGSGDDMVRIAKNVKRGLTVKGGGGHDTLVGGAGDDTLRGGAGKDYIEGRGGNDRLHGGGARDTLYGLNGKDELSGGRGRDYLDGGRGADALKGGENNDQLLGGRGKDHMSGGSGDDVLAGGAGQDTSVGGEGRDRHYAQADDKLGASSQDEVERVELTGDVGSSLVVEGSDEFKARAGSDLDALRSLPSGRRMLEELDASGKTVTLRERPKGGNSASGGQGKWMQADGTPGEGSDGKVNYNTTRTVLGDGPWRTRPPIVGLFHEMAHAHDYAHGALAPGANGSSNRELAAVGLPFDHDANPDTPLQEPTRPAENDLRRELGLPLRPRY